MICDEDTVSIFIGNFGQNRIGSLFEEFHIDFVRIPAGTHTEQNETGITESKGV